MGKSIKVSENLRLNDAILLFDNYNQDSQALHTSLKLAGFDCPAVVIEDDGFLPDDVMSVYGYFLGDFKAMLGDKARPKYFNEITVPDYWEISGTNSNGKVQDLYKERGRMFYAEPKHKRLVKIVDWYDERGVVRSSDHYNRYGAIYGRTIFNNKGQKVNKSYFSVEGKEIIVENFVTGDIILNEENETHIFRNKTELVLHFFVRANFKQSRIFFNSLSTPLFVSERMPDGRQEDVLFWQEGVRNDIPGNMQLILSGQSRRTKAICVQRKASYEKLIQLGASKEKVSPLGFVYEYSRKNTCRNKALICTNSDRIQSCEELIKALPNMDFYIAAVTEMSSRLMELSRYDNVSLYPAARAEIFDELFDTCDYYLDINYEAEIVSAVKQAFLHDQLILGFKQTLHNRTFIPKEHVFDNQEDLVAFLNQVMDHEERMREEIDWQKKEAMSEEAAAYAALLK